MNPDVKRALEAAAEAASEWITPSDGVARAAVLACRKNLSDDWTPSRIAAELERDT